MVEAWSWCTVKLLICHTVNTLSLCAARRSALNGATKKAIRAIVPDIGSFTGWWSLLFSVVVLLSSLLVLLSSLIILLSCLVVLLSCLVVLPSCLLVLLCLSVLLSCLLVLLFSGSQRFWCCFADGRVLDEGRFASHCRWSSVLCSLT